MHLKSKTEKVLRTAKQATNYMQLEQTVPFSTLQETINQLLQAHDRAIELAQARKSARRWTPQDEEQIEYDQPEEEDDQPEEEDGFDEPEEPHVEVEDDEIEEQIDQYYDREFAAA